MPLTSLSATRLKSDRHHCVPVKDPLTRKSFPRIAATFSWMVSRAEAPGCSFDDGESQG
jgi:hypothetical protein